MYHSFIQLAHAGHDHSHPLTTLTHAQQMIGLGIIGLIVTVLLTAVIVLKHKAKNK